MKSEEASSIIDLIAQFTDASAMQYLAALVGLVWLLGVAVGRGGRGHFRRPRRFKVVGQAGRGSPDSVRLMVLWFVIATAAVAAIYAVVVSDPWGPPSSAFFSEPPRRIAKIIDGDSIALADGTQVRLHGIDAPEYNQPYGRQSKRVLSRILGRYVYLDHVDTDSYGRVVAVLWTADRVNVNVEMVCRGAAWWYRRYARGNRDLKACEETAKASGLGLWAGEPVAPWLWRRRRSA